MQFSFIRIKGIQKTLLSLQEVVLLILRNMKERVLYIYIKSDKYPGDKFADAKAVCAARGAFLADPENYMNTKEFSAFLIDDLKVCE